MSTLSTTEKAKVPQASDHAKVSLSLFKTVLSHPLIIGKWIELPVILHLATHIPSLEFEIEYSPKEFATHLNRNTFFREILIDKLNLHCLDFEGSRKMGRRYAYCHTPASAKRRACSSGSSGRSTRSNSNSSSRVSLPKFVG